MFLISPCWWDRSRKRPVSGSSRPLTFSFNLREPNQPVVPVSRHLPANFQSLPPTGGRSATFSARKTVFPSRQTAWSPLSPRKTNSSPATDGPSRTSIIFVTKCAKSSRTRRRPLSAQSEGVARSSADSNGMQSCPNGFEIFEGSWTEQLCARGMKRNKKEEIRMQSTLLENRRSPTPLQQVRHVTPTECQTAIDQLARAVGEHALRQAEID